MSIRLERETSGVEISKALKLLLNKLDLGVGTGLISLRIGSSGWLLCANKMSGSIKCKYVLTGLATISASELNGDLYFKGRSSGRRCFNKILTLNINFHFELIFF
jgi:hypothetical protein